MRRCPRWPTPATPFPSARQTVVGEARLVRHVAHDHRADELGRLGDLVGGIQLHLREVERVAVEKLVDLPGVVARGHEIASLADALARGERPDRVEEHFSGFFLELVAVDAGSDLDRPVVSHGFPVARPANALADGYARDVALIDLERRIPTDAGREIP